MQCQSSKVINRLRRGKPRAPSLVKSPCIKLCTFDKKGEYCIGCYRTAEEMRDWYTATDQEKHAVLARIAAVTV